MPIELKPAEIRRGWVHGENALSELGDARQAVPDARGSNLEDLQTTLTDAGNDIDGVLKVAEALISEFGGNNERCITEWHRTDGQSDGAFKELEG